MRAQMKQEVRGIKGANRDLSRLSDRSSVQHLFQSRVGAVFVIQREVQIHLQIVHKGKPDFLDERNRLPPRHFGLDDLLPGGGDEYAVFQMPLMEPRRFQFCGHFTDVLRRQQNVDIVGRSASRRVPGAQIRTFEQGVGNAARVKFC